MDPPTINSQTPPKGKRSIRNTVWGNTNTYVSGKFWKTIGPTYSAGTEIDAQAWLDGTDNS